MRIILLTALFAASAFSQSRGASSAAVPAPAPRAYSAPPSAMHPIVPHPSAPRPVGPPSPIARPPVAHRPNQPRNYVPVPYPVFIGGGYYREYTTPYIDPSPIAVVNPDYRPDSVNPVIVDYSNAALPEAVPMEDDNENNDDQPTVYLIALTDHTVVAAIAYWVTADTLNWVSRDAKQNILSLSLVDRDFSKQLNDERRVEFKLPPVK